MTHRREELEPFITAIFDAYVEAMALEGCWGGVKLPLACLSCHMQIASGFEATFNCWERPDLCCCDDRAVLMCR